MPAVTRPGTPQPSPLSKRQRTSAGDTSDTAIFPYPPLPAECIVSHREDDPFRALLDWQRPMHRVCRTRSTEWGSKELAEARASVELTVTSLNEQLIRTYHPSLSQLPDVWAVRESDGKWIWVAAPSLTTGKISTHAAGREIHFCPQGIMERTTTVWPKSQSDPIHPLNPRRFLSQDELCRLRQMFPSAVGARVFISGFIVILFRSRRDIEKSWLEDGPARDFGELRLRYDVLENIPTQKVLPRAAPITEKPDSHESVASLGLKIRFPSGQEAITVPTHAFVPLRPMDTPYKLRIADLFGKVKKKLARFAPVRRGASELAVRTAQHRSASNSPLGKEVFLTGNSQKIGTITSTYDPPASGPARFPASFRHDIYLVTAKAPWEDLPRIASPDHTPQVTGWASYKDVLDGFNVPTGNIVRRIGYGVSGEAQRALALGSKYSWDKDLLAQNVSILWRTEWDGDRLEGLSGTALCLGRISDKTCLAVCFQNFEHPLYFRAFLEQDHHPPPPESCDRPRVKAGFILPVKVREAQILCDEPETSAAPSTYPSRERASTELRRAFSSHR